MNVSKSSEIIFARAGRRFIQPRSVTLFAELIKWFDSIRYLGMTLDDSPGRLTSNSSGGELLEGWAWWVLSWARGVMSPSETGSCCTRSLSDP
jgi:hypothetical protein